MSREWDDDYTEVPLCPHCNAEYTDPWEHNLGDGDTAHTDCGECGGKFKITGQITCEYMTEKELRRDDAPIGNRHEHCPLCIEEEEEPVNPWKGLKKKIEDAEKKPCLACGSEDDIEASHNCHPLDGGDLAAEILIVPLCKNCRRRWFLDWGFRKALIRDHPVQLDAVSF